MQSFRPTGEKLCQAPDLLIMCSILISILRLASLMRPVISLLKTGESRVAALLKAKEEELHRVSTHIPERLTSLLTL